MENFTPLPSLIGGILIGLSATGMLVLLGRVAGISGIVGGLLAYDKAEYRWRAAFVAGLLLGGAIAAAWIPDFLTMKLDRSPPTLIVAGLLVGFGSRLGSGCTSGHGVCGMARGSRRSIAATITFLVTGAMTAFVVQRLLGGHL